MRIVIALVASSLIACVDPSEDPTSADEAALGIDKISHITTISYAPNSFVIGNA